MIIIDEIDLENGILIFFNLRLGGFSKRTISAQYSVRPRLRPRFGARPDESDWCFVRSASSMALLLMCCMTSCLSSGPSWSMPVRLEYCASVSCLRRRGPTLSGSRCPSHAKNALALVSLSCHRRRASSSSLGGSPAIAAARVELCRSG